MSAVASVTGQWQSGHETARRSSHYLFFTLRRAMGLEPRGRTITVNSDHGVRDDRGRRCAAGCPPQPGRGPGHRARLRAPRAGRARPARARAGRSPRGLHFAARGPGRGLRAARQRQVHADRSARCQRHGDRLPGHPGPLGAPAAPAAAVRPLPPAGPPRPLRGAAARAALRRRRRRARLRHPGLGAPLAGPRGPPPGRHPPPVLLDVAAAEAHATGQRERGRGVSRVRLRPPPQGGRPAACAALRAGELPAGCALGGAAGPRRGRRSCTGSRSRRGPRRPTGWAGVGRRRTERAPLGAPEH